MQENDTTLTYIIVYKPIYKTMPVNKNWQSKLVTSRINWLSFTDKFVRDHCITSASLSVPTKFCLHAAAAKQNASENRNSNNNCFHIIYQPKKSPSLGT